MKQLFVILVTAVLSVVVTASIMSFQYDYFLYDRSSTGLICRAYDYEYTVVLGRFDDRVSYCTNLQDAVLEDDLFDSLIQNIQDMTP
jgi:hypothetical protein